MNVLDLTPEHIGATVTIRPAAGTSRPWSITGSLTYVSAEQETVEEWALADSEPAHVPTHFTVEVGVGPFRAMIGDPAATLVHLGGAA